MDGGATTAFRQPGALGWVTGVVVLLGVVLLSAAQGRGTEYAVVLAGQLALPMTLLLLALWMPQLQVRDDAAVVRGVLRTVRVPWHRLQDVRTTWYLELEADGRTYRVRAVPAVSSVLATREVSYRRGGTLERSIISNLDRYDRTGGSPVGGVVAQRWAACAGTSTGDVEVVRHRWVPVLLVLAGAVSLLALVV